MQGYSSILLLLYKEIHIVESTQTLHRLTYSQTMLPIYYLDLIQESLV